MKRCFCYVMILLVGVICCMNALAEGNKVYAPQGDVAFFQENGKVGLQTTDGEVLHTADFDGAAYFDVTEQANVYIADCIGRIDRKGTMIVEPFLCDSIEAIPTNCVSEEDPQYVLLVTWYGADGKKTMKLMSTEGKWISEVIFDLMIREYKNGKLFIGAGNKYNQIDINGHLSSEEWWEDIFVPDWNENEAETINGDYLYFNNDGELWGKNIHYPSDGIHERALIREGKSVSIPASWEKVGWADKNHVEYCVNGLWGLADFECNVILQPSSISGYTLVNDERDIWLIREPETQIWKWIHSSGETILSLKQDEDLLFFGENQYLAWNEEKTKLIDNNAAVIAEIDGQYDVWYDEGSNVFRYTDWDNQVWGFISIDGRVLSKIPESLYFDEFNAELHNGWLRVVDEKRMFDDHDGRCGYVNAYGDALLSKEWENIKDFSPNQLACVEVNGLYGYISNTGEYAVSPQWEYADSFFAVGAQYIAPVYKTTNYQLTWQGYINENNELVGEHTIPHGKAIDLIEKMPADLKLISIVPGNYDYTISADWETSELTEDSDSEINDKIPNMTETDKEDFMMNPEHWGKGRIYFTIMPKWIERISAYTYCDEEPHEEFNEVKKKYVNHKLYRGSVVVENIRIDNCDEPDIYPYCYMDIICTLDDPDQNPEEPVESAEWYLEFIYKKQDYPDNTLDDKLKEMSLLADAYVMKNEDVLQKLEGISIQLNGITRVNAD